MFRSIVYIVLLDNHLSAIDNVDALLRSVRRHATALQVVDCAGLCLVRGG